MRRFIEIRQFKGSEHTAFENGVVAEFKLARRPMVGSFAILSDNVDRLYEEVAFKNDTTGQWELAPITRTNYRNCLIKSASENLIEIVLLGEVSEKPIVKRLTPVDLLNGDYELEIIE